jgi:hypothetical protein
MLTSGPTSHEIFKGRILLIFTNQIYFSRGANPMGIGPYTPHSEDANSRRPQLPTRFPLATVAAHEQTLLHHDSD